MTFSLFGQHLRPHFALMLAGLGVATAHGAAPVVGTPRFNRDVLPILAENCFACHGSDNAGRKGGLRLDRREDALGEAGSGARAIVPGDLENSELLLRIVAESEEDVMPPTKTGKKLKPAEVDILKRWIAAGAPYEKHWAFVSPVAAALPKVDGTTHPIDRFVRARLQEEGIQPSPEASKETLIRRLSLDLTGLPPSREEVESFVTDTRADAYDRAVSRLLGSAHYGEKWGRWWLDLAHYGDSDGIRLDNVRPTAWRYRQWVVDALNADLPFDQFTVDQLAGDLLPEATVSQRVATGFMRNTISDRQTGNADPELGRVRQIIDRTSTTSVVWLGLSMGCAQCHDHKFDPVSQKEFFQLYSFFNDADEANVYAPLPGESEKYRAARPAYDAKRTALLAPIAEPLAALQAKWEDRILFADANPGKDHAGSRALEILVTSWGRGKGEGQFEGLMIVKTPAAIRTADQQERLQDYFLRNGNVADPEKFKELGIPALGKQLDALAKELPTVSRAQAMTKTVEDRVTQIHLRGDFRRPGEAVPHATPAVLPPLKADGKADRLDLARWLVAPENPLTSRVTVNRLWQELFGRGIVGTSENLGFRGERPSHPELLDWLALEFPKRGWSIKEMVR
ncbi:MAG: PSD1 and planctomycete cytochrome C domain-containing protein, partial [Verrucomicrobiota bacterium]